MISLRNNLHTSGVVDSNFICIQSKNCVHPIDGKHVRKHTSSKIYWNDLFKYKNNFSIF